MLNFKSAYTGRAAFTAAEVIEREVLRSDTYAGELESLRAEVRGLQSVVVMLVDLLSPAQQKTIVKQFAPSYQSNETEI
jgi:hypothetical protein